MFLLISGKKSLKRLKINKKCWKRLKKVVQPAFGCAQHPKAGRNTQHPLGLVELAKQSLKCIKLPDRTRGCKVWKSYNGKWRFSGDQKSDHSKSGNIWNLEFWRPDFKWSDFQRVRLYLQLQVWSQPFKMWTFLLEFQMVGLLDFRSHSKLRPFANKLFFNIQNLD